MSKTKEILQLLELGYRLYGGTVPEDFYRQARCPDPEKAEWFTRPWSDTHKHSRYICLGCGKRCATVNPKGWQLLLPLRQARPGAVVLAVAEELTVDDLLRCRKVLRVDEAAWALSVSRQKVHEMIACGDLDTVRGTPARVTSASVKRNLEPYP